MVVKNKAISLSRINELIDDCKKKGVSKISIPNMIDIEFFPFAYSIGQEGFLGNSEAVGNIKFSGDNDKEDLELLLHSSN